MNEEETTDITTRGRIMHMSQAKPRVLAIFRETRSSERVAWQSLPEGWAAMAAPSIVPMRICCSLNPSSCSHKLLMCQRQASYPLGSRPISLPAHFGSSQPGFRAPLRR
ncbi:hypothetical protein GGI42DRAFT_162348 [Trichoderma sp. SZMC 28013]